MAKAALGHGQEWNDFYDQHILGPSTDRPVSVQGMDYQGETNGNGKATLGQIDTRLGKINDLLRPAYDKASSGASMTALERSGLQDEANALRTTLYSELSKDTGMTPDAIRQIAELWPILRHCQQNGCCAAPGWDRWSGAANQRGPDPKRAGERGGR